MPIFRSFSEIVNSIIERLRLTQPNLDTKPGSVARDLFIDIQADQIQRLHSSLLVVSEKQSPESAVGKDLDRWANNFGIVRRSGAPSNGIVVFTVNEITSDIPIPEGSLVSSRGEEQFRTIGNFLFSAAEKSRFAATASRLRSALDLAGITDSYAIEIPVRAAAPGTTGNISSFQIVQHNLKDAVNVTNLSSFSGGTNPEGDSAFRSRVFSVFSGSNVGTAFGYKNTAISIPGVNDAVVIEPGNSLMLRDGTETIQVNDGSFRVLESGTGGKVDLYILGKQLQEVVESYIFTDRSGTGNAADERNDYILGQSGLDSTLTSEERRVKAFKSGIVPLQPADTVITVIGSSSGILAQKSVNADGTVSGNFELIKDTNPDTGGSPFGFDKIRYISNQKQVDSEVIIKQSVNSVDPLRFPGAKSILDVYQDISIVGENSKVSSADRTVIKLSHAPALTVSRVSNKTTGEIYVIQSQNINSATGLNDSGEIIISGKTLPAPSDILSVNYIWRSYYDKYVDYNGQFTGAQFVDKNVANSIDWGTSNGIYGEATVIGTTEDDLEYQVEVSNDISRVVSVYSATFLTATVSFVQSISGSTVKGIEISITENPISNIKNIKNENGVELYNTVNNDGTFYSRIIILPTDSPAQIGDVVQIVYNRLELFDISQSDGAFSNNIITLPSKDILSSNDILDDVEEFNLVQQQVYVDYIADITDISPAVQLTALPISGSTTSNNLINSAAEVITDSSQPVRYNFDTLGNIVNTEKFSPTRLAITVSGSTRAGKIKITGESITRLELEIIAGVTVSGLKFNLSTPIKNALGVTSLPISLGIARVDSITSIDNPEKKVDLIGHKLQNNIYGLGVADLDTSLSSTEFLIPSTTNNTSQSFSSAERLKVSVLVYNSADSEELYFAISSKVITDKKFSRISKVSVSSGFRSPAGSLVGSLRIESTNQPGVGISYFSKYKFTAPIEGERISIRYNLNKLISDVTRSLEGVRCITADVLVKESPILSVDVSGEIIVNSDFSSETNTVIENASNAVSNLLNSSVLGSTIDYSDIINSITTIAGVDSVNISLFNESGSVGRRSYIKALDNQSISAGQVRLTSISRKDFRIT